MGAKSIWLGDVHVEFGEVRGDGVFLGGKNASELREAAKHAVDLFAPPTSRIIPNDEPPGGDVAEEQLTEEEKALKAKKDYEKILFASAD